MNRIILYVNLFFTIATWTSCEFFSSSDHVLVFLPEEPVPGFGASVPEAWLFRWLTDHGKVEERIHRGSGPFSVHIFRELPTIITARPLHNALNAFWQVRCSGYVSAPHNVLSKTLKLTWRDGFAAKLMLDLADAGVNLLTLNTHRLTYSINERAPHSPWEVDRNRLISDLIAKKMRVFSIQSRPGRDVHISLPPGTWYDSYPLNPPLLANEFGWSGYLSNGLHQFLRLEDGQVATVWLDSSGDPLLWFFNL